MDEEKELQNAIDEDNIHGKALQKLGEITGVRNLKEVDLPRVKKEAEKFVSGYVENGGVPLVILGLNISLRDKHGNPTLQVGGGRMKPEDIEVMLLVSQIYLAVQNKTSLTEFQDMVSEQAFGKAVNIMEAIASFRKSIDEEKNRINKDPGAKRPNPKIFEKPKEKTEKPDEDIQSFFVDSMLKIIDKDVSDEQSS